MAARNLGQLRQAVQDEGYGSDLVNAENGWINSEYRSIAGMRRWHWLDATTSFVTAAGTSAYTPVATDIRAYIAVRLDDSFGNDQMLEVRPTLWVRDKIHRFNTTSDLGSPRYWAAYAGQVNLYPIPDDIYTAQVDYTKNIVAMVVDADTHLIPEAYDDVLVWGAIARGAVRQNNWLTRDFALQQRQSILNEMLDNDTIDQRQSAGEVEWTGMWDAHYPWR